MRHFNVYESCYFCPPRYEGMKGLIRLWILAAIAAAHFSVHDDVYILHDANSDPRISAVPHRLLRVQDLTALG